MSFEAYVLILVLFLNCCLALGKLLSLPMPLFPSLENRATHYPPRVARRIKR